MSDGAWAGVLAQGISDTSNMIYNGVMTNYWNRWHAAREDTAISRAANDMRNAGLSPTLAAGNAAQTQQPIISNDKPFSDPSGNIMGSAMLDLLRREQTNKDNIAEAEATNINARTDQSRAETALIREQRLGAQTHNVYREDQILAELRHLREENLTLQQGRRESESRVQLNEIQQEHVRAETQKVAREIEHIKQQINLDMSRGRTMEIERKQLTLKMLQELQENYTRLATGNMQRSWLGKMATDLITSMSGQANAEMAKPWAESYIRLMKELGLN